MIGAPEVTEMGLEEPVVESAATPTNVKFADEVFGVGEDESVAVTVKLWLPEAAERMPVIAPVEVSKDSEAGSAGDIE
jgi:hypothetical protein